MYCHTGMCADAMQQPAPQYEPANLRKLLKSASCKRSLSPEAVMTAKHVKSFVVNTWAYIVYVRLATQH